MIEQRTEEWFKQRLGKVTASRIADVIAKTKTGPSASRANYMAQLIAERLTGQQQESYSSAAMEWGTQTEPLARSAYEINTGRIVLESGFVLHPDIKEAGASPDGIVWNAGLIEIKCPNTATHIETLLSKEAPSKYMAQMQWQMACTGRQWCDFVSFNPSFPAEMQLHVKRITRDDKLIGELEEQIGEFLKEVEFTCAKLVETYKQPIAAE